MSGVLIGFGVFGAYALLLWGIFRWLRHRLFVRAQQAAEALTSRGAKIIAVRPSPAWGQPAEVEFELDGKHGRFHVRRYGRDWIMLSVHIDSPPQPAIWIRKKGMAGLFAKAIGLTREVLTGDPDFDDKAQIASNATDEQVHSALGSAEVRRGALDLLALDYTTDLSPDGLRATHMELALGSIDMTRIPDVMRALEGMAPKLARFEASTLKPMNVSPVSIPVLAGVGLLMVVISGFAGTLRLWPPPVDDVNSLKAMGAGLIPWLFIVFGLKRALHGRPMALLELIVCSILGFFASGAITAATLFAVNARLDSSPLHTYTAEVVSVGRRDSEVRVVPWDPTHTWQKVPANAALRKTLSPGDRVEVDVHPGVLGWPWVSEVRKAP
jgi:hypothetical protein